MEMNLRLTVMVHAFKEVQYETFVSQEHCDKAEEADGWNVWLRLDGADWQFESVEGYDKDFDTLQEAMDYALKVQSQFVGIPEIDCY